MKKTIIYTIFVVHCAVSVTLAAQGPAGKARTNRIHLKSRQFTPSRQARHAAETTGYTMIQFDSPVSQETVTKMEQQNIKILQRISHNTVMAHIPRGKTIDMNKSHIRWLGKLQPSDKQSRHLHASLKKGYVLVDVFPDVDDEKAADIIRQANGTIVDNPYLNKRITKGSLNEPPFVSGILYLSLEWKTKAHRGYSVLLMTVSCLYIIIQVSNLKSEV